MRKKDPAFIAAITEDYYKGLTFKQIAEKHVVSKSTLSIYLGHLAKARKAVSMQETALRNAERKNKTETYFTERKVRGLFNKQNRITAQLKNEQTCEICSKPFYAYFKKNTCSHACAVELRSKNKEIKEKLNPKPKSEPKPRPAPKPYEKMQYCKWCDKPFRSMYKRFSCSDPCKKEILKVAVFAAKRGYNLDVSLNYCLDNTCKNYVDVPDID